MEKDAVGLCLAKMVMYVDSSGKASNLLGLTNRVSRQLLLPFTFADGGRNFVDRNVVLPSGSEVRLERAKPDAGTGTTKLSAGFKGPHRIDAFFAKRADDPGMDVHAEGQMMMRLIKNPGSAWDCSVNPQPTINDLLASIDSAEYRNLRSLHLSGYNTCVPTGNLLRHTSQDACADGVSSVTAPVSR
jgi:hypothetical protein